MSEVIVDGKIYEIVKDASLLSDDASDWVSDWGTADEAVELED